MAVNPNRTDLDFNQIFQRSFDEDNDRVRVDAAISLDGGITEVVISHANDSIRLGDGTSLVTTTSVGPKVGLDVYLAGGTVGTKPSGLNVGGRILEVTLNASTWTALPPTPLSNRNAITIQNRSGVEIVLNFDNSVSGYKGIVMPDQFERFYDITDDIVIYAKSSSGNAIITVEELA